MGNYDSHNKKAEHLLKVGDRVEVFGLASPVWGRVREIDYEQDRIMVQMEDFNARRNGSLLWKLRLNQVSFCPTPDEIKERINELRVKGLIL